MTRGSSRGCAGRHSARLAGLTPAGVLAEVTNNEGSMARQ